MKKLAILGSTGSIGRQCFKVIDAHPGRFEVVALAAGSNIALVAEQVAKYRPQVVSVGTESGARELCAALKTNRGHGDAAQPGLEILFGAEGIERVATHPDTEMVVSAAVGVVGLPATYKAIELGKEIALANKEVLVAAGEVVMAAVKRHAPDPHCFRRPVSNYPSCKNCESNPEASPGASKLEDGSAHHD
jgi:1-deoxy-D-xylulose-5-phosphate reductoisomerase